MSMPPNAREFVIGRRASGRVMDEAHASPMIAAAPAQAAVAGPAHVHGRVAVRQLSRLHLLTGAIPT